MATQTIVNDHKMLRQMRAMSPMIRKAIEAAVEGSVKDVEFEAKRMIMHDPKTGTVRVVTKAGRTHQASAPGEAPATNTGKLVGSITHEIDANKRGGNVIARTAYATHLELGTKNMKARPFLFPALVSMRSRISKRFRKAVVAGARKASKR